MVYFTGKVCCMPGRNWHFWKDSAALIPPKTVGVESLETRLSSVRTMIVFMVA